MIIKKCLNKNSGISFLLFRFFFGGLVVIGLGLVLVAGLAGGDWLARYIDVGVARIGMLVLAFGGGIAALVKGLLALV